MARNGSSGLPDARPALVTLTPLTAANSLASLAATAALPIPGFARPSMPSRATVHMPGPAPAAPVVRPRRVADRRAYTHATSGRILVAAVAAGAVVPAVQAFGVPHVAQAESGTAGALDAAQMALASQRGAAAAPAVAAISDVTTISMSAVQAASAAKPATSDVGALGKAMSVAREKGPLEFGRPYVAGGDGSLDDQISQALGLMGLPQRLAPGVKKIIMRESTGNPDAINKWDSNAAAGTPSKGLMQLIDVTFRNAVLPSLADKGVYDPVANITAGVRTMIANHGIDAVMDGGLRNSAGNYIGYGGAKLPTDGLGRAD